MPTTEELRQRMLTPPTSEQLRRRREVEAALVALQVDITPLTVTELRRLAREDCLDDTDDGDGA